MRVKIFPKDLNGCVSAPSSKSITHRVLIACFLKNCNMRINNPLYCLDTFATIDVLRGLGAKITCEDHYLLMEKRTEESIKFNFYVGESGSTARFFIPIISLFTDKFRLIASERLLERINTDDLDQLEGLDFVFANEELGSFVQISGSLKAKNYRLSDKRTTQLITGMLFCLPFLKDTTLYFSQSELNNPYIVLTLDIMIRFGFHFKINKEENSITFDKAEEVTFSEIEIEGDYSNASYFLNMKALNKKVFINNLNENSFQGDKIYKDFIEKIMDKRDKTIINVNNYPDLAPALFALSAVCEKEVHIIGIEKLFLKESDRVNSMITCLKSMGASIFLVDKEVIIYGKTKLMGNVVVDSFNDHRVVMSLMSISSRITNAFTINRCECINKSFPEFFKCFCDLNGHIELEDKL